LTSDIDGDEAVLNGLQGQAVKFVPLMNANLGKQASLLPAPSFATIPKPQVLTSGWRAASMFSGCGGLDLGFLQQGVLTTQAYEIDQEAISTYNSSLVDAAFHSDLGTHTPALGNVDLLLAGAPCQGFSTAGRRNLSDPRNALLYRIADVALAHTPKILVVENVPAATSGSHLKLWNVLEDRLKLAGYNIRRIIIDGISCGLAQKRRRLFLIAWRGSDCINLSLKTSPLVSVRDALSTLDGLPDHDVEWPVFGSKNWVVARKIPPGHKLSNVRAGERAIQTWDIPEIYGTTSLSEREVLNLVIKLRRRDRVRAHGDGDPVSIHRIEAALGRLVAKEVERLVDSGFLRLVDNGLVDIKQTYNGRFRRLEWGAASPTVDTRFGRMDLFVHPEEHRGLTPREAARIQGFPDKFAFSGTRSQKFTQIGNAVPPPMASVLAEWVREALLKA
jgi:DNA (cytosine-5)-methyltransferase 1